MKILITGGLGYIGSYLIKYLRSDIVIIDNLYTQRYCSLFYPPRSYKLIEDNFNNLTEEFLSQFDYIIHLAAIVDAANSHNNKSIIEDININNTIEFFKKCKKSKIIFPSSTSVYGISDKIVFEDDKYINPQSLYAEAKIKVENFLRNSDLNYVILRLGTVCGISPGIRFQTVINKFCYQAAFDIPLTIWQNNLELVRPYLTLADLLNTFNEVQNRWDIFENGIYNVLTQNLTLSSIIKIISKIKNININYTDCPLLNQFSYEVSNQKIKEAGVDFFGNIENEIVSTILLLSSKNYRKN